MDDSITVCGMIRVPVAFAATRPGEVRCYSWQIRGLQGVGPTMEKAREALRLELEDLVHRGQLGRLWVETGEVAPRPE